MLSAILCILGSLLFGIMHIYMAAVHFAQSEKTHTKTVILLVDWICTISIGLSAFLLFAGATKAVIALKALF